MSNDKRGEPVVITSDALELVDDMRPEWMSRGAFLGGCAWMFYGHQIDRPRHLSIHERVSIRRLKKSGVHIQLIADAFGVSESKIRHVKAKSGEGGKKSLHRREE